MRLSGQLLAVEIDFMTAVIIFWRPIIEENRNDQYDWDHKIVYSRTSFNKMVNMLNGNPSLKYEFYYQNISSPVKKKGEKFNDRYTGYPDKESFKV